MPQKIDNYKKEIFEKIKHIDEYGNEYWYARELQKALEYKEWRKFKGVIDKAKITCENSNYNVLDHFVQVDKMVEIGSKTNRKIIDFKLSRHACYLVSQNGDSHLKAISLAQSYFAYQTRKQELLEEELKGLSEDEKRIRVRNQVKNGNFGLNRTAAKSGVKNFGEFHNAGYKGLYNGETADDIAKRKNLKYNQDILDYMGSKELAANLFRITQTEDMLENNKIDNEYDANSIHYNMGKDVREFIKNHSGTMPEDLPMPKSSIKEINKE